MIDKRIALAKKMLKAVGTASPRELAEAALICVQVAAMTSDPLEYKKNLDEIVKDQK